MHRRLLMQHYLQQNIRVFAIYQAGFALFARHSSLGKANENGAKPQAVIAPFSETVS